MNKLLKFSTKFLRFFRFSQFSRFSGSNIDKRDKSWKIGIKTEGKSK